MARHPSNGKPVNVDKCIELYHSGLSMNEVGRQLGHHHSVIKYHLIRNNVPIRPQSVSQRKNISSKEIAKLYKDGMSAVEIADEFGITYQCVYDRLAEYGMKIRSRKEQIKIMIQRGTYNIPKGPNHPNWNGGITIDNNGYRHININGKYIPEHRIVWEKKHGDIPDGWIVHHLNGNKLDNRIENLSAMPRKQHSPKLIIEPFRKRILELEYELDKLLKKRV
jgi:DNA-binding CsgD family transcriptional regulator